MLRRWPPRDLFYSNPLKILKRKVRGSSIDCCLSCQKVFLCWIGLNFSSSIEEKGASILPKEYHTNTHDKMTKSDVKREVLLNRVEIYFHRKYNEQVCSPIPNRDLHKDDKKGLSKMLSTLLIPLGHLAIQYKIFRLLSQSI